MQTVLSEKSNIILIILSLNGFVNSFLENKNIWNRERKCAVDFQQKRGLMFVNFDVRKINLLIFYTLNKKLNADFIKYLQIIHMNKIENII